MGKKNKRFSYHMLLTGLGFIVIIIAGLFVFMQFRSMMANHNDFAKNLHNEYFEYADKTTLENDLNQQEILLKRQDNALTQRIIVILGVSFLIILVIIGYMIWLNSTSVLVSARDKEGDERTRAMLDATPLSVSLFDQKYNVMDCNREVLKLFDLSNKQEYMEKFYDLSPEYQPDGRLSKVAVIEYIQKTLKEKYCRFEWTHQKLNGELIPCDVTLVRIMYKGYYSIAAYARDLREMKAAMEKMREADERIRLIFDTAPFGCHIWDKNFNIIDCNHEIVKMFKLPNKQVFIERFFELSPEYQPCGRKSTDMAAENNDRLFSEGICSFEWMHQTLNGEPVPCEVSMFLVKYRDQYVGTSYLRDLREEKALQAEIHKENERVKTMAHWYESILDAIPFSVAAMDLSENCTFVNTAAETLLNKRWEEIVGAPCKNWGFSICDTENCAITCAKRGRMRTHFLQKNESYQVDTKLLKDTDDNTVGYIEVIQDITKMEHLAKQQAAAEAASSAKSSFLSTMSHEMRTPMNAIIGMATVGISAENIERKTYALKKIEGASKHLLGIINDVLDMSKIEANKLELSHIIFDLKHSLHKAVSLIQFSLDEKQIQFSMNVDENIPSSLIGDDQRLTQIITNLLSNAVKFTPEKGSVKFAVFFSGEENEVCDLRFEITDSGIGVSPEQQGKIFNAFEQADSGTTRKFGGTGLGLVITQRIVELMGGKIWVESELGKGARFIFTIKLPRDKATLLPTDYDDAPISIEDIHNEFNGKKILVVEDIEINREVLISLLEGTGLLIATAGDGKEAVDMIKAAPDNYDLIFMDMQMPVMDGLEATRQIRAFEKQLTEAETQSYNGDLRKHIPIIAMTSNVFQEDIEKCRQAGMDDHIGKPLDIVKVLEKLREYLAVQRRELPS